MKNAFRAFSFMALGAALCIPASADPKAQLLQEMCQADERVETALAANDSSHLKSADSQSSAFCKGFIIAWAQTIDGLAQFEANADATWFSFPSHFNVQ